MTESSISAGPYLRRIIAEAPGVAGVVTEVFPVITPEEAILPYVVYRCASMQPVAVKAPRRGPDRANYELTVCAADYDRAVAIAEAVRAGVEGRSCGIVYAVEIVDRSEGWTGDCYYVELKASVRTAPL